MSDSHPSHTALDQHVQESAAIVVFLSEGYFYSQNCQRELDAMVDAKKPIILVHETDRRKGGISLVDAISQCPARHREALFGAHQLPPIPWLRIHDFQLQSLKMILEQVSADYTFARAHVTY